MDNFILPQDAENGNIQATTPYHCPACGAPIREILHYNDYLSPTAQWKPLDDFGDHLHYLNCHACHTCQRVARLGDVILPFDWPPEVDGEGEARLITHLLQRIAQQAPQEGNGRDPVAAIVYHLVAGVIAPTAAIREIHGLAQTGGSQCLTLTA